jgi:beta-phosphoglucomutase-like phosphatase (HAD superfamily)
LTLRPKRDSVGPGTETFRGLLASGARRRAGFAAVLLDLDGCLLDSNDAHARAWSRALARFGHRVDARRIRYEIGMGGAELLRDFVGPAERHFLGDALGQTQTRLYLERFASEVRPIRGAAAAVRGMRRAGIEVVLASSAAREVVERSLRRLRLADVVTGFTTADDVEKAKPFDDVFSLAIRRFGLAGARPVAVGDTPYDVAAAHQIGVPCLALESGGFPRRSLACADGLFASLGELWSQGRGLFA